MTILSKHNKHTNSHLASVTLSHKAVKIDCYCTPLVADYNVDQSKRRVAANSLQKGIWNQAKETKVYACVRKKFDVFLAKVEKV